MFIFPRTFDRVYPVPLPMLIVPGALRFIKGLALSGTLVSLAEVACSG
jgi:hypothetical protein